jgi:hypothetical protein
MTSAADLIHATKRHLQSFQREPMNRLGAAATADATTLTLEFDISAKVQEGSHLQIGLELVYVWSVSASSKVATVERGQLGSTAAAHDSGAVVTVNPKFPDFAILQAINDDLLDLSSPANGLYTVRTADLTFSSGSAGYDFPATNLLEILEIRHRIGEASGYRQWPLITNYELSRSADLTDFPSGNALFLAEGGAHDQPLRVVYKSSFSPLTALAEDVETGAGLPTVMHDIPPLGAAMRMIAPREVKRNFTEAQGEPRRAGEVPPGAVLNSLRGLAGLRQSRIVDEAARLYQQHPDRGFIPQPTGTSRGSSRWGSRW